MENYPTGGKLVSWNQTPQRNPVYRTEMERGPAKQTKISGKMPVNYQVAYVYSMSEFSTWKTFFKTKINNGADWFTWAEPFGDSSVSARIVDGKYTATPINARGNFVQVEMLLEVIE